MSSIRRNRARLDLQLYLEFPDELLDKFNKPGYKADAMHVLTTVLVGSTSAHDIVTAVEQYAYEVRTKTSGGNVQAARDTHLKGQQ